MYLRKTCVPYRIPDKSHMGPIQNPFSFPMWILHVYPIWGLYSSPHGSHMGHTHTHIYIYIGKIQGDGGKFLDHFKSYFGSQTLSQSLNEIRIYWLQAKSTTKDDLFLYYFLSVQFGACCPLTFYLVFQQQRECFLHADFCKTIVLTTQHWQIAIFSVHFWWFLIATACLTRPLT